MIAGAVLRSASPAEAGRLAAFARRCFVEAFAPENTAEDIASYAAARFSIPAQRQILARPDVDTLVCEIGGELAAYAELWRSRAPDCLRGDDLAEIRRFYVAGQWQGRGVAQPLMEAVRDAARRAGARRLWLAVWEDNPRALAFYGKCGFRIVGSQPFVLGAARQTDHVMVRELA